MQKRNYLKLPLPIRWQESTWQPAVVVKPRLWKRSAKAGAKLEAAEKFRAKAVFTMLRLGIIADPTRPHGLFTSGLQPRTQL